MVPSLLFLHRSGRLVHFLADWNFRLIPGVGFLYARAQVVTVTRKSAKPRVLNLLKPLYEHAQLTLERATSPHAGRTLCISAWRRRAPSRRGPLPCAQHSRSGAEKCEQPAVHRCGASQN
jgi:hypothetical protein